MLYAWIGNEKRQPAIKGERAICRDCGAELISVLPIENVAHWRHRAGDCDSWSEPEGPWHLGWKAKFEVDECEVAMTDGATGERHRADVLCDAVGGRRTLLELQHSSISDEERIAREQFYGSQARMLWLLHVANDNNLRGSHFALTLSSSKPIEHKGKTFYRMTWFAPGRQFIDKWKRSSAHVFLDHHGHLYYLATPFACADLVRSFGKGEFALCPIDANEFVRIVRGFA